MTLATNKVHSKMAVATVKTKLFACACLGGIATNSVFNYKK